MPQQTAVRNRPDATRSELLDAALSVFHSVGFQAASLADILARTDVTKGALYHHFASKQALGWAVTEERLQPLVLDFWVRPLQGSTDPLTTMQALLRTAGESMSDADVRNGCPLNNLAQEMSNTDEGFRIRIARIYQLWREGLIDALKAGQLSGTVSKRISPLEAATFIIGALQGCLGVAKNAQSVGTLRQCGLGLIEYLEGLRSPGTSA